MSSLDPKDAVADYSTLNEAQMKTLDGWETFFQKVSVEASCPHEARAWRRYSF
jgi:hypothetical protein